MKTVAQQARAPGGPARADPLTERPDRRALGLLQTTVGNAAVSSVIRHLTIQRQPVTGQAKGPSKGAVLALGRWQGRVLTFGGLSIPLSEGAAKEFLAGQARAAFPDLEAIDVRSLGSVAGDRRAPVTSAEHRGAWAALAEAFEDWLPPMIRGERGPRGLPSAVAVDEALEGAMTVGRSPVPVRGIYLDATGVALLDDFHTPAEYRRIVTALASGGNAHVDIVIQHGAGGERQSRIAAGTRTVTGSPLPAEMRGPLVQGGWDAKDFLPDPPPGGAGAAKGASSGAGTAAGGRAAAGAGEHAPVRGHGPAESSGAHRAPAHAGSHAVEAGTDAARAGRWAKLGRVGRLLAEGILFALPDIALQIIMYRLEGQLDEQEKTNLRYGWEISIAPALDKYVESQQEELARREEQKLERCFLVVEFDVEYRAADKYGGMFGSPGPYLYESMTFRSARLANEKASSHKLVAQSKLHSWHGPDAPMPFKTYRVVTSIKLIESEELLKFEREAEARGYGGGRQYGRIPEY